MVARVKMQYTSGLGFVQRFNTLVTDESKRAINEANFSVRETMVRASPFGGTSLLKQSWLIRVAQSVGRKIVGSVVAKGSIAANVIEKGARPHFPPVGAPGTTPALGVWIRRKLGITDPTQIRQTAFAIGRKFRRRGIPRKRTFSIAFDTNVGKIFRIMNNMTARVSKRF